MTPKTNGKEQTKPQAAEEAQELSGETAETMPVPESKPGLALILSQLTPQYTLPWQEQAKLIIADGPVTQAGVNLAVTTAKSFLLPLQGINILRGKIYVNSEGVRWRMHTDPRTVVRSEAEIVQLPEDGKPYVVARATIVMGSDPDRPGSVESTFINYGVVDVAKPSETANAIMKAVTKAKRRAGVDAVGAALPIAEDYLEAMGEPEAVRFAPRGEVIDGEARVVTPGDPTTVPAFLSWAMNQMGCTPDELKTIVGDMTTLGAHIGDAVAKVKAAKGK